MHCSKSASQERERGSGWVLLIKESIQVVLSHDVEAVDNDVESVSVEIMNGRGKKIWVGLVNGPKMWPFDWAEHENENILGTFE